MDGGRDVRDGGFLSPLVSVTGTFCVAVVHVHVHVVCVYVAILACGHAQKNASMCLCMCSSIFMCVVFVHGVCG